MKVLTTTCLMCLSSCILVSSANIPPPTITEARHISLNAVRVSWEITATSLWNRTKDITGFEVALSKNDCPSGSRKKKLDKNERTTTFWEVMTGPLFACVQTMTSNETSNWGHVSLKTEVKTPPRIVSNLAAHKIYYPSEDISLPCEATGSPPPEITWFVNGKLISSSWNGYELFPNGTLYIDHAYGQHQGEYRCHATNTVGRAVSDGALLEFAVLDSFPYRPPNTMEAHAGHSLRLPCAQKPHSVPDAEITWYQADTESNFVSENEQVITNHRRALAPDGSLLFISVVSTDSGFYKCELWNNQLDKGVFGSGSIVAVRGGEDFRIAKPSLLDSSSDNIFALEGDRATITCIFGGRPTPDILWTRVGGRLDSRHRVIDYNRTLVIDPVRLNDTGDYECIGSNKDDGRTLYSHPVKFKLIVNARPRWVEKPAAKTVSVGDNVTFECRAEGFPAPAARWLINGEPIHMQNQNSKMHLTPEGALVLVNVTKDDMQNLQCNVSNTNGYLFANAFLNVLYPVAITLPPSSVVLAPGNVVLFECGFEADPGLPVAITWLRGGQPIVFERGRIYETADHTLVINTTLEEDGGLSFVAAYTCHVENGVDSVEATAKLQPPPSPQTMASAQFGEGQDFLFIGLTVGLTIIVIVCLVALSVFKKRQQSMLTRSGTDTSILTYLSSASRLEEETTRLAQSDMTDFPLLPYLDDEQLKANIKAVLIQRSRIHLGTTLGKGQFGRVYAGVLKDVRGKAAARVAVKTLKYKPEETEIVELFLREAIMMKDFKHPNVLSLIGISVDEDGSPMVILPLMENSDLRMYVQDPEKEITVLELLVLGLQVARGMIYLSDKRFIHRDLAARNCMVDANRNVKVADFGLSRDLFARDYYRIEDGKTPLPVRWMAPESLTKSVFTTMSDVWSYGVLLWELMTRGAVPYPDVDNWDIAHYIESGKRLAQPHYCPDSIYEVMVACWEEEPEHRPTFERIVKEIEGIVDSARTVPKTSSHLYLNIHTMAAVSDYREVSQAAA